LRQFIGFFGVSNDQGVQVPRAADFELRLFVPLSDLYQLGIGSACLLQKVADICDLFRHFPFRNIGFCSNSDLKIMRRVVVHEQGK